MVEQLNSYLDYVRRGNHHFLKIILNSDNPHYDDLIWGFEKLENLIGSSNTEAIKEAKGEILRYVRENIDSAISVFADVFIASMVDDDQEPIGVILVELN